ncbi:MAG: hypothetical protein M3R53_05015 [Candidatus Eremiobacteraeota bacterium]|nr:hypothetical protein [Candidatus Eremiobacteraeota bacterium]
MFFKRTALARYRRIFVLALVFASASPHHMADAASRPSDQIGALEAAETFGYAWASRDAKIGAAMVDFGRGEGSPSPDAIRSYFIGLSSPHHTAFAVERIDRMRDGGYACTMTLYEYLYAGHGHGDYTGTRVIIRFTRKTVRGKLPPYRGCTGRRTSGPGCYISVASAGG